MVEDFISRGPPDVEALVYYDLSDRLVIFHYNLSERITPLTQHRVVQLFECTLASFGIERQKMHYIDGPGGSRKTYLFNTIHISDLERSTPVICVAWTGIVASLLPEGGTASSTFELSMGSGNWECLSKREDRDAIPLKQADAIVRDEISMVSKFSLEAVALLLQDLICNTLPF
ncbi:hypothetical protein Aduo_018951 [Ancylostoma duodenale]